MNSLYLDCKTGISGDMLAGSLLDLGSGLGVSQDYLFSELKKLHLNSYTISVTRVNKAGTTATKFTVNTTGKQEIRHLPEILGLIEKSELGTKTKKLATEIFVNLAHAEAVAHKTSIDELHFHEIGAVDSIIDIVSAGILINKLEITEAYCSMIALGSGTTETLHGTLPVPTPAVQYLLRDYPTQKTGIQTELTTPTGAAIIKTIAKYSPKIGEIKHVGCGAGTKDLDVPNVLETILAIK